MDKVNNISYIYKMKAMILAAGYGTRLRPLTYQVPKPLLPYGGQFILTHTLDLLRTAGIKEVMINLHHLPHVFKKIIGNGSRWGLEFHYSDEPVILGSAGGIKKAENFLKDDDFLVINADIVFDLDLKKLLSFHQKKKAYATLVLRRDREMEKFGVIVINPAGKIVKFLNLYEETPMPSDAESPVSQHWGKQKNIRAMFSGIQVLSPKIFKYIPAEKFSETTKDLFPLLLQRGFPLYGYLSKDPWQELGTLEDYLSAANKTLK